MQFSFRTLFHQQRLLGGALVLAITQFGASLAGLVRDNVLAGTFQGRGEIGVVDAYIASFRPSDLILQAFVVSAIGAVFVPILASYREKGKKEELDRLLGSVVGLGAVVFGSIALVLAIIFPRIAHFFVEFQGTQLALYVQFVRVTLLSDLLFIFGMAYGQYLITIQRYWIYGITPILYTVGTILGTLFLTPFYGSFGPIIGTLSGTVAFVALRLWAVHRSGTSLRLHLWHPEIAAMGLLMIPRMAAQGASQIQLLFFDKFASGLDAGSVMVNAYARNFQSVIVGVAGIAVAQSAFALLSKAAARNDVPRFRAYLWKGTALLTAVTIPGSILLVLLSPVAARLVNIVPFLSLFHVTLFAYAISIPFESINHLLLRGYYATKHTLTPAIIIVAATSAAVLSAWWFMPQFGVRSLGMGYALGAVLMTLLLAALIPARIRSIRLQEVATPSPNIDVNP